MKPPKVITPQWLRKNKFCNWYVEPFAALYPKGLPLTEESIKRVKNIVSFPSPSELTNDVEAPDELSGKELIGHFVEGCIRRNIGSRNIASRLTKKAIKQLDETLEEKNIDCLDEWAEQAEPKHIVHFCTWAMSNWK